MELAFLEVPLVAENFTYDGGSMASVFECPCGEESDLVSVGSTLKMEAKRTQKLEDNLPFCEALSWPKIHLGSVPLSFVCCWLFGQKKIGLEPLKDGEKNLEKTKVYD